MSSTRAWRSIDSDGEVENPTDMAPPWARYPEIIHGSIGWRMGAGEDWIASWSDFLADLPRDREQRLAYLRRHPPAPRNWAETAVWVVDPELHGDDDAVVARREALQRELERLTRRVQRPARRVAGGCEKTTLRAILETSDRLRAGP